MHLRHHRFIALPLSGIVCLVWLFSMGAVSLATADPIVRPEQYVVQGYRLNQITEDRYFRAPNGMTSPQIQQFLEQRKSVLAKPLPLYRLSPSNQRIDTGKKIIPSTILYQAQRAHGIHAAVLLTLLQKEQGLLHLPEGKWKPDARAFVFAMGYGAMDSGDLLNMSGFDKQIDLAAKRLRRMFDEAPTRYPQRMNINGGQRIAAAGKIYPPQIDVNNRASQVLYRYTPWAFDPKLLPQISGGNLLYVQVFAREFQ
jgi:hypothetical protein